MNDIQKQYNNFTDTYNTNYVDLAHDSNNEFYEIINTLNIKNGLALDLGCGPGDIIDYLQQKNITCFGVDSSEEMVAMARLKTKSDIRLEDFAKTSFGDNSFNLVTAKWSLQTAVDIDPIYQETYRVLKLDGLFVFLVTHPIRHFLEKKKKGKNYFKKEIVDSIIFEGKITLKEPSHTLTEYISPFFLRHFKILGIQESFDFPGAEQINGDIYPTHLIVTAQKICS